MPFNPTSRRRVMTKTNDDPQSEGLSYDFPTLGSSCQSVYSRKVMGPKNAVETYERDDRTSRLSWVGVSQYSHLGEQIGRF